MCVDQRMLATQEYTNKRARPYRYLALFGREEKYLWTNLVEIALIGPDILKFNNDYWVVE